MASLYQRQRNSGISGITDSTISNSSTTTSTTTTATSTGAIATYAFASYEAFAQSQQSSLLHQQQQRSTTTTTRMLVQPPSMLRMESSTGSNVSEISVNTMISKAAAAVTDISRNIPKPYLDVNKKNTENGRCVNSNGSTMTEGLTTSWEDYSYVDGMSMSGDLYESKDNNKGDTLEDDNLDGNPTSNPTSTNDDNKDDDILYLLNSSNHRHREDKSMSEGSFHGIDNENDYVNDNTNNDNLLFHQSAPVLTTSLEFQSSESSLKRLLLLSNTYRRSCMNLDQKIKSDTLAFVKEHSGPRLFELDTQLKMLETTMTTQSSFSVSAASNRVSSSSPSFLDSNSSSDIKSKTNTNITRYNHKTHTKTLQVDDGSMPFEDVCMWLSSSEEMSITAEEENKFLLLEPQRQRMLSGQGLVGNLDGSIANKRISTLSVSPGSMVKRNTMITTTAGGGGTLSYCSSISGSSGDTGDSDNSAALAQCRKNKRDLLLGKDPMPEDTKRRLLIGHPSLATHAVSQRSLRPSLPSHASTRRSLMSSMATDSSRSIKSLYNKSGGGAKSTSLSSHRHKQDFKNIMTLSKARFAGPRVNGRVGVGSTSANIGSCGRSGRRSQPQRLGRVDEKSTHSITSNSSLPTLVSCGDSMMSSLPTPMSRGESMMSVSESAPEVAAHPKTVSKPKDELTPKSVLQASATQTQGKIKSSIRGNQFDRRQFSRRPHKAPISIMLTKGMSASKSSIMSGVTCDSSSFRSTLTTELPQDVEPKRNRPCSVATHPTDAASKLVNKNECYRGTDTNDEEILREHAPWDSIQESRPSEHPLSMPFQESRPSSCNQSEITQSCVPEASVGCVIHSNNGQRSSRMISVDDCQKTFGNGERVMVRGLRYYFETILLQGRTTQTTQCFHCQDLLEVDSTAELVYCCGCGEISPLAAAPTLTLKDCAEIMGIEHLEEANRYLQRNQQEQRVIMMSFMQQTQG